MGVAKRWRVVAGGLHYCSRQSSPLWAGNFDVLEKMMAQD
jgi:hypothetical protein